jgi:hypothetical protein
MLGRQVEAPHNGISFPASKLGMAVLVGGDISQPVLEKRFSGNKNALA